MLGPVFRVSVGDVLSTVYMMYFCDVFVSVWNGGDIMDGLHDATAQPASYRARIRSGVSARHSGWMFLRLPRHAHLYRHSRKG